MGWSTGDGQFRWATAEGEAGTELFRGIAELDADPMAAGAFVFCDGPGSMLGVRSAATAVRTWCVLRERSVYSYHSLAIVAAVLADSTLTVIADARRETWHCLTLGSGLRRVPTAELPAQLVRPEGFRTWSKLDRPVRQVPYSLADMLPKVADADLFHLTAEPDAFLHQEPSYAKWTPQIHRAP